MSNKTYDKLIRMLRVNESDPLQQEAADALDNMEHENDIMGRLLVKQQEQLHRLQTEIKRLRNNYTEIMTTNAVIREEKND